MLNQVDGKRSVAEVVQALKAKFPDAPDIEHDIIGMFDLAIEKGWPRQVN